MKPLLFNWSNLRAQLIVALSALVGLIGLGTVVYHYLEGWTWLDSFYFSVCTVTTLGYGDLVPTSEASRLFTAVYVLLGVSVAFTALGIIGASYLRRSQEILLNLQANSTGAHRKPQ
jgi:hypothetical protein